MSRKYGAKKWLNRKFILSSSLLRRGSKGFFSGWVDPLSNVSAGTELQATAESAGASARYHTQDGSELLSGVVKQRINSEV